MKAGRGGGITALSICSALGALIAATTGVALVAPGTVLDAIWRLKPAAHAGFQQMGPWAILLMGVVALACAGAAVGLWIRAPWGRRLALIVLVGNAVGDTINGIAHDPRTLIGLPIAGLVVAWLLTPAVRAQFER